MIVLLVWRQKKSTACLCGALTLRLNLRDGDDAGDDGAVDETWSTVTYS